MMKKISIIISLLLFHYAGKSQLVASFDLYFESDSYNLNVADKGKVDSVIRKLSNIPMSYSVSVYGHTDNEGDMEYNKKLSLQRAEKVKTYLCSKGFSPKHISTNAYAFTKPAASNKSETGKSKNRRVNVRVYAMEPDLSKIFPSSNQNKTYSITINEGGKFKYSSGTEINIPPDAFVTMDGKNVTGKIEVKYTEYRSQLDFIKSGIPMSFFNANNELVQFNSGGMFKIEAYQENQQLKLKSNSTIKINFAKTQSLPEMKFFALDTIHNAWVQDNHNMGSMVKTVPNSFSSVFIGGHERPYPIIKRINQKDSCIIFPCSGTLFAARKGLDLAKSKMPVNLGRSKIYFKDVPDPRNKIHIYNLKIISYGKDDVEFQIIPLEEESVFEEFKSYHWIYGSNKKHPFKKNWEKILWLRIKVDYLTNDDFNLTFYSNGTKFTIAVKAKYKPKGWSKEEIYIGHQKNKNVNLDRVLEQVEKEREFDQFFAGYIANNDFMNPNEFEMDCTDSLFCLYQYSRQWMDPKTGEDNLGYKEWYDYFNSNKELMKTRYTKLLNTPSLVSSSCLSEENEKYALAKKVRRTKFLSDSIASAGYSSQMKTLDTLFQELSITNLGVWNCDQIQRLKEPVYVKKTYKNGSGKKVEPVIIYIIDKEVSGTLTYNGYQDLSPYYFPLSSKSENTLIAFDIKNQAYVCKADKMKEYINPDNTSEIILELLTKPETQLTAVLK